MHFSGPIDFYLPCPWIFNGSTFWIFNTSIKTYLYDTYNKNILIKAIAFFLTLTSLVLAFDKLSNGI